MAVAALVISILALAVASVSALFSKRQTSVAERREAVDAGRRHDERTPSFTGDIESVNDGEWYRLWLRLTSTEELAHLQIDITESNGVTFATGQDGVIANGPSLHAESVGGLVSDQAIAWRGRCQVVEATVLVSSFVNASRGVRKPRTARGRSLSSSAMALR